MSYLDDLPKHDKNRELDEESKSRFRTAISDGEHFVVQSVDDSDYGVDFWLEARDGHEMTNVRVAVQLKGTRSDAGADGAVSRSVKRTTLNYLAMHAASVFVCYHAPSDQLLVRRVDDVLREYEYCPGAWGDQSTVTVRFENAFSLEFQKRLKEHVIASARGPRDRRYQYATLPPERLAGLPEEMGVDLPVPADVVSAEALLSELYRRGQDRTISCNFEKFHAVLGGTSIRKLSYAYMAEINLGVNGQEADRASVAKGIEVLQDAANGGVPTFCSSWAGPGKRSGIFAHCRGVLESRSGCCLGVRGWWRPTAERPSKRHVRPFASGTPARVRRSGERLRQSVRGCFVCSCFRPTVNRRPTTTRRSSEAPNS